MTDPYQVLGISPGATDDEVKRAYKELSRKYHPDAYVNNPLADLAEDKFKEIQAAYTQIMEQRAGGGRGYSQGSQNGSSYGGYSQGGQGGYGGYSQGGQGGYSNGTQGYNNGQYNRQSYQNYGAGYGRNPNSYNGSGGCGTGNFCCDLWCADTLCECLGGDLCSCI